jgi:hypothetical protein
VIKGCTSTVSTNLSVACYSGDPKTRGKGECKDGLQKCQADGKLGPCVGDVLPTTEYCDSKDNDCTGVPDEGCAPVAVEMRFGMARVSGSGATYTARVWAGGSTVAGPAGGTSKSVTTGFYAWLRKWMGL